MTPRVRLYACIEAANNGVTVADVFSATRRAPVVRARHSVMRRLHGDGFSSIRIGRWMGRDHTTVLHALGKGAA